jgi:hypothetical protein
LSKYDTFVPPPQFGTLLDMNTSTAKVHHQAVFGQTGPRDGTVGPGYIPRGLNFAAGTTTTQSTSGGGTSQPTYSFGTKWVSRSQRGSKTEANWRSTNTLPILELIEFATVNDIVDMTDFSMLGFLCSNMVLSTWLELNERM